MAPNQKQVELQTFDVLECLFRDSTPAFRSPAFGDIETDSPGDFDPVLIADKLKAVADALNEDAEFKAAMRDLKQVAAQEALDKALSSGINKLVQSQVGQRAEVVQELQIIKTSVAVALYMKKTYPQMREQLQTFMGNFLNQRVGSWVTQQGGWERVTSENQL